MSLFEETPLQRTIQMTACLKAELNALHAKALSQQIALRKAEKALSEIQELIFTASEQDLFKG